MHWSSLGEPANRWRSSVTLLVSALVLGWLTCAVIEPVFVLDLTAIWLARLLTAGIIVSGGYWATELIRSRRWSVIEVLRVTSWLSLAALVWIREGVTGQKPTPGFVMSRLVVFVAAGVGLHIAASRTAWLTRASWRRPAVSSIIAAFAVFTLLMAAPIIAHRWDVSGWMDSHSYDSYAMNILTGKVLEGSSAYMPAYQYGLASVYYVFGHFFFVQQGVNAVLAVTGMVALALAAWTLFESVPALVVILLMSVFARQYYYAVYFTQIESWYVPLVCVLMLAWARYWRKPNWPRLAWLAATVALGINMRNQGAPFLALMCTTPLWVTGVPGRQRWVQCMAIGALVALSLVPWTIRNYVVEGRLSPSGSRSAMYIGVLNDRRVGLYGIRYWEGWGEVVAEFQQRYPDPVEREHAYVKAGWDNMLGDPAWLGRAMLWRTAGYYGLLPDTMLAIGRILPTDWRDEWRRYVFGRTTQLVVLPLSFVGLLWRRDRTSWFLLAGIIANISILLVSATSEDRISYPALPLHMLLAAGVFAPRSPATGRMPAFVIRRQSWIAAGVAAVLFVVACRVSVGSRNTYRLLMERGVAIVQASRVDDSLVALNDHVQSPSTPSDGLRDGQRVRLRAMVSNYMVPPKSTGIVDWLPVFVSDPVRETYYFTYLLDTSGRGNGGQWVGVSFLGAQLNEAIREGDAADIEGELVHVPTATAQGYFVRAAVVRRLAVDASQLPAFP